jgi:hypothetical protein
MRMLIPRSLLVLAGLLLAALPSGATPVGSVRLDISAGTAHWAADLAGTSSGTSQYAVADGSHTGTGYLLDWSGISLDTDPGVSGNWSVVNTSLVTQTITLSVSVPVLPVAPSSLMFGSTTLSVADSNGSGAGVLASFAPLPVYTGLIDLAPVAATALFADPYTLTAPPGGTIGATASFGVFPGSVPGPAVVNTIGIQHVFTLTAGDRATLNSTFWLIAVPEPGTLVLLVTGLLGLGVVGRRRS